MSEHVLAADREPHTGNGRGLVPVSVVTAASQSVLQALTLLARFHSPELWTADVRAKIAALELGL